MFTIYSSRKGMGTVVYNSYEEAKEAAKAVAKRFGGYAKIIRNN